jgi:Domain of unknown function (DUF4430)
VHRKWWSYGALVVAGVAVFLGVSAAEGPHRTEDSHWVTALNNNVAHEVVNAADSAASTSAANTASQDRGASSTANSPSPSKTSPTRSDHPLPSAAGSTASRGAGATTPSETTTSPTKSGHSGTGSGGSKTSGTNNGGGTPAQPSKPTPQPDLGTFTIVVSEDKGQTVLSVKKLAIVKGESLMQYMQDNYHVETAYGDDFLVAINGIRSQWTGVPANQRQPVDWFLYVNNQQAPVGAADIYPRAGDVDNWDYHRWDPSTGKG